MKRRLLSYLSNGLLLALVVSADTGAEIVVGDRSVSCAEDPACINRLHPEIPMVAEADPGERIVFLGRDAFDLTLDPDKFSSARTIPREGLGIVHALTGPVFITGAKAGDVLAESRTSPTTARVSTSWRSSQTMSAGPKPGHSGSPVISSALNSVSSSGESIRTMRSAMHSRVCEFPTRVSPAS